MSLDILATAASTTEDVLNKGAQAAMAEAGGPGD
jgi:hypothetical protein